MSSPAELDLERIEEELKKQHPLLAVGNPVAPVTRQELLMVLAIAKSAKVDTTSGGGTDDKVVKDLVTAVAQLSDRVKQLETEFSLHDNNGLHWTQQQIQDLVGGKPAAPGKPEPKLDLTGADELKALGVPALRDFAQKHGVDVSALPDEKDLLAEYIAAELNLNPPK